MLTQLTIRKINDQIQEELDTVSFIGSSDQEKAAALDRIAKLKALLTETPEVQCEPLPSRKTLLKELATALLEAREETRNRNQPADFWEAIFGIRR